MCLLVCDSRVCLYIVTAEEREGKLVTRTVSMPSVRLTTSMAKGVSFYMKNQPPLSENEEEPAGKWKETGGEGRLLLGLGRI